MKRLAIVLAAGVAAVGLYAVTAPAGPDAVSPRRVAALERKVTTLQRQMRTANAQLACMNRQAAALASYGVPDQNQGYVYVSGQQEGLTTALDVVPQGQQPEFFVPILQASCVGSSAFKRMERRAAYPKTP
jgi:hypothetical protein